MPQRLFALLLCAALLISAVPPALAEDQPIEAERFVAPTLPPDAIAWDKNHPDILDEDMLYAHSAILIEADTGEVLFEKNADEIMFPASTTKIMTAYIALQMSDLENDVVTVSQNAIDLVPPTYQTIPLIAGEQVPMLDLISVMLIRSGTEENLEKKRELWSYIKEHDLRLFHHLRAGIMGNAMNLPGRGGRKISVAAYKLSQKVVGFN